MAHASQQSLDKIEELLTKVRRFIPIIKEKKRGIFYRKSQAFLHFHDNDQGIVADLKVEGKWQRWPSNNSEDWQQLIQQIELQLN